MGGGAPDSFFRSLGLEPSPKPLENNPGACYQLRRQPSFSKPASAARTCSGTRRVATIEQRIQQRFRPGRDWCTEPSVFPIPTAKPTWTEGEQNSRISGFLPTSPQVRRLRQQQARVCVQWHPGGGAFQSPAASRSTTTLPMARANPGPLSNDPSHTQPRCWMATAENVACVQRQKRRHGDPRPTANPADF